MTQRIAGVCSMVATHSAIALATFGCRAFTGGLSMVMTAVQVTVGETTFSVMGSIKWDRRYEGMLATPVRPVDVVVGHLAFVLVRLVIAAVVFLGVATALGTVFGALMLFGTITLLDIGVDLGLVKKSGAWYTYDGEQLGQGRENAKQFLLDHPELMVEISERIRAQLGITAGAGDDDKMTSVDDEPITLDD